MDGEAARRHARGRLLQPQKRTRQGVELPEVGAGRGRRRWRRSRGGGRGWRWRHCGGILLVAGDVDMGRWSRK